MRKINTNELAEETWASPKGKFVGSGKKSPKLWAVSPIPLIPTKGIPLMSRFAAFCQATAHTPITCTARNGSSITSLPARESCRHQDGRTAIETGDVFIFKPGEAHQIFNDSSQDLILYVVADNPIGESTYYPDSKKWGVRSPERRLLRSEALETTTAKNDRRRYRREFSNNPVQRTNESKREELV